MSLEMYERILDDLKRSKYMGEIHLYLMAEPLCDPRMKDWIRMAREVFPQNIIFISTNGDYLDSPETADALIDAGLTWMAISDYAGNGRFNEFMNNPDVVVTKLADLEWFFYNRGGHVNVKCPHPKEVCDWVFGKAYINYRGEVILCCSDYNYEVVFGNVKDKRFIEIYNCPEYRRYRKEHAQGRGKSLPLCERCNRIQ